MRCQVFSHTAEIYKRLGGFNEEMRRLVDWELILRYTEEKPPILIPVVLNKYYFGYASNQITQIESYKENLKKLYLRKKI